MENALEALGGGISLLALVSLPFGALYFSYRAKVKRYDSLLRIAELGGSIDSDVLESLGEKRKTYRDDFRLGIIWIAVGLPLAIGGGLEIESIPSFIMLSVFWIVGVAYLISGQLRLRGDDD